MPKSYDNDLSSAAPHVSLGLLDHIVSISSALFLPVLLEVRLYDDLRHVGTCVLSGELGLVANQT